MSEISSLSGESSVLNGCSGSEKLLVFPGQDTLERSYKDTQPSTTHKLNRVPTEVIVKGDSLLFLVHVMTT